MVPPTRSGSSNRCRGRAGLPKRAGRLGREVPQLALIVLGRPGRVAGGL